MVNIHGTIYPFTSAPVVASHPPTEHVQSALMSYSDLNFEENSNRQTRCGDTCCASVNTLHRLSDSSDGSSLREKDCVSNRADSLKEPFPFGDEKTMAVLRQCHIPCLGALQALGYPVESISDVIDSVFADESSAGNTSQRNIYPLWEEEYLCTSSDFHLKSTKKRRLLSDELDIACGTANLLISSLGRTSTVAPVGSTTTTTTEQLQPLCCYEDECLSVTSAFDFDLMDQIGFHPWSSSPDREQGEQGIIDFVDDSGNSTPGRGAGSPVTNCETNNQHSTVTTTMINYTMSSKQQTSPPVLVQTRMSPYWCHPVGRNFWRMFQCGRITGGEQHCIQLSKAAAVCKSASNSEAASFCQTSSSSSAGSSSNDTCRCWWCVNSWKRKSDTQITPTNQSENNKSCPVSGATTVVLRPRRNNTAIARKLNNNIPSAAESSEKAPCPNKSCCAVEIAATDKTAANETGPVEAQTLTSPESPSGISTDNNCASSVVGVDSLLREVRHKKLKLEQIEKRILRSVGAPPSEKKKIVFEETYVPLIAPNESTNLQDNLMCDNGGESSSSSSFSGEIQTTDEGDRKIQQLRRTYVTSTAGASTARVKYFGLNASRQAPSNTNCSLTVTSGGGTPTNVSGEKQRKSLRVSSNKASLLSSSKTGVRPTNAVCSEAQATADSSAVERRGRKRKTLDSNALQLSNTVDQPPSTALGGGSSSTNVFKVSPVASSVEATSRCSIAPEANHQADSTSSTDSTTLPPTDLDSDGTFVSDLLLSRAGDDIALKAGSTVVENQSIAFSSRVLESFVGRIKCLSGWHPYVWYLMCRRPELDELGVGARHIAHVTGKEWEDLQKDQIRLGEFLTSILRFSSSYKIPKNLGRREGKAFRQFIAREVETPYKGVVTSASAQWLNGDAVVLAPGSSSSAQILEVHSNPLNHGSSSVSVGPSGGFRSASSSRTSPTSRVELTMDNLANGNNNGW